MADGKVSIKFSAETKEAARDMKSLQKRISELNNQIETLSDSMQAALGARVTKNMTAYKSEIESAKKEVTDLNDALFEQKKIYTELSKKYPKIAEIYGKEKHKKYNKGLVAINLKKNNIPTEDYAAFSKSYRKKETLLTNIRAAQDRVTNAEEKYKVALQNEYKTKTKDEIQDEKRIKNLENRRDALEKNYEVKKQEYEVSKTADEQADREEKRAIKLQSVKATLGKIAITSAKAVGKITIAPLKGINSVIKKVTKSVVSFGKKLKNAIMQGLIFRNLRKYLAEFSETLVSAIKQNGELNKSLANLKGTFWTAITPIVNAIAPIIAKIVNWLALVITYVSTLINMFFGLKKASTASAKAMSKAGDEAKSNFASWDTIQQLSQKGSDSGSIEPTFGQDFSEAENALANLKKQLDAGNWYGVGEEIANGLNSILTKINEWSVNKLAPTMHKISYDFATLLNGLVDNFDWSLLGETLGNGLNIIIDTITTFLETFDAKNFGLGIGEFLSSLIETFDAARFAQGVSELVKTAFDIITGILEGTDWQQIGQKIIEFVDNIDWSGVTTSISEGIGAAIGAVFAFAWGLIKESWKKIANWWHDNAFEDGKFTIQGLFDGIKEKLKDIATWIKTNIFQPFIKGFKNAFGIASPSKVMKQMGQYIMDGLKAGLKGGMNAVILILNNLIAKIETGINNAISGIKGIIDFAKEIPAIGSLFRGVNFKGISLKRIPYLSQGTVVNPSHEFAAILGDNRREQEVVSPLSTMKQAFIEAIQDSGFSGGSGGVCNLQIDGMTFAKLTVPYIRNETKRVGLKTY